MVRSASALALSAAALLLTSGVATAQRPRYDLNWVPTITDKDGNTWPAPEYFEDNTCRDAIGSISQLLFQPLSLKPESPGGLNSHTRSGIFMRVENSTGFQATAWAQGPSNSCVRWTIPPGISGARAVGVQAGTWEVAVHLSHLDTAFYVKPQLLNPGTQYSAVVSSSSGADQVLRATSDSALRGVEVRPTRDIRGQEVAIIVSVDKSSPGWEAKLRVGDEIYQIRNPGVLADESVSPPPGARWTGRRPAFLIFEGADFIRLASGCIPACLVDVGKGGPRRLGFRRVGNGDAFVEMKNFQGLKVYLDKRSGLQWPLGDSGAPMPRPERTLISSVPNTAPQRAAVALPANDIAGEIETIRQGSHAEMPPAQSSAANLGGQTRMVVENGTSYTLSLLVSGPVSQKIQIAAGSSQTIQLLPGNYEVAASVSNPNVTPFYGKETLGANTQYSEKFFISGR